MPLNCYLFLKIILWKHPDGFQVSANVIAVKRRFGYAQGFARGGVQKCGWLSGIHYQNSHMPGYPVGAIGTGKKYQVAGFGLVNTDLPVNVVEIYGAPWYSNIEVVEYISDIARTIKALFRISRAV